MCDAMLFFKLLKLVSMAIYARIINKCGYFLMVGIKLVDNIISLWDYFVQIDFSFGLTLFANGDFSFLCLEETISFVESNYRLLEKSMGGF
jgi:hypothetical protein